MANQTIFDRVKEIVVAQLNCDPSKVTEDANLVNDLGADSLDTIELAMDLEAEFLREIPDEHIETLFTVGDVVKYIQQATGEQ